MIAEQLAPASVSAWHVAMPRRLCTRRPFRTVISLQIVAAIWMNMGAMATADDLVLAARSAPAPAPASAPSFRIETEVFEGTQVKPQSQHLLLFDAGIIYDLPLGSGSTISVFDPVRSRVMLLHKIQRVRTSISTDSLIQISAQVRSAAIDAGAGKSLGLEAKVLAAEAPDTFSIEFADTKYTVTTQPALKDGIAGEYAAFTVWACRLNLARHVGSPPFARMTLADFLAAEKVLPRQIKLDVRRGLTKRAYRSEHLFVGRLGDLDRKRINDVGEMIASYTEVEFAAFPLD
jgi:hypothetical protein